jgi:hypothetical protein
MIRAIEDGLCQALTKKRMAELEAEKDDLEPRLAAAPEPPKVRLAPELGRAVPGEGGGTGGGTSRPASAPNRLAQQVAAHHFAPAGLLGDRHDLSPMLVPAVALGIVLQPAIHELGGPLSKPVLLNEPAGWTPAVASLPGELDYPASSAGASLPLYQNNHCHGETLAPLVVSADTVARAAAAQLVV